MEKITLTAKIREEGDKANALRRQGFVPGVVYGKGSKNYSVAIDGVEFGKVFKRAGHTSVLQLKLGEKTKNVLIHVVDRGATHGEFIHVDFLAIKMNEKIVTMVPLEFVGEAPAVAELDGTLVRQLDEVEVEALPANLPHQIEVDVTSLATFDDVVRVSDLVAPEGVQILTEGEEIVAMVEEPRSEEEMAELEAPVEETIAEEGAEAGEAEGEEAGNAEEANEE